MDCLAIIVLTWSLFTGEIQLATAYMTGKFELKGDVTKLMSIEGILKATKNVSKKA